MKTAYIAKQRQISFVKSHFSRQLEERLGLKVIAVRVGAVDFLRDMAVLRVYYEGNDSGDVKNMLKIKNSEYASV